MKTLVILAHPTLENSIANKSIIDTLHAQRSDIEVRHLDALYPSFNIDIAREQEALKQADIIVLQFPLFWYSVPAILKHWMDTVLSWGFAYGTNGDKLKGKFLIVSTTVGGAKEAYTPHGYNHFSMEQLLRPIEQTAYLTQMHYQQPVYTHRNFYAEGIWNSKSEVRNTAKMHSQMLLERIENLITGPKKGIEQFVYKWFKHFDFLDENSFFTQYLDKNVSLQFPQMDVFKGHDGFHTWYNQTKANLLGSTSHKVENVQISKENNKYKVEMILHFEGTSTTQETIQDTVKETWTLSWDRESQRPNIHAYLVEPLV